MRTDNLNRFSISVEKQGARNITKATFPLRYGTYSEIKTADHEFLFNLNGEIKFIRGLNTDWPHPAEQLKRTDGNDWVYYAVGDQSGEDGVISWLGEYYLPCLPYPSNSVWEMNYFANAGIMKAYGAWSQLYADLYCAKTESAPARIKALVAAILSKDDRVLHERSQQLRAITGERVSVLPPDTRHVDYEVIPLMISDGCLYHCKFCCVKSARPFCLRSHDDILKQISELKAFYGRNIANYNALFLGNHDALSAGGDLIERAATAAFKSFEFGQRRATTPALFMFGSVDALLKADSGVFETINHLPFYSYINIGFESMDAATLAFIRKPVEPDQVCDAFQKMIHINADYANLEISGNFLLGEPLSQGHYESLGALLRDAAPADHGKGAIYLSPLKDSPKKRELLPRFYELKRRSRLPVYAYLIQRL